jgi:hypothetical protein
MPLACQYRRKKPTGSRTRHAAKQEAAD